MKESKILLVDDEEIVLARGRAMLKSEGYKVTTAESGEEAIKLLEKNTFDLVMADLAMGDVDGFAVVKKAKELYPETTTMVLTGSETTDFIIDALRISVDDYMIKPNKTDDTLFRVLRCLEKHKANKERRQAEEKLLESEESYRNLVNLSPAGILVLDLKGKVRSVNTTFEKLTGYSQEEIVGKHFTKLPTLASMRLTHFIEAFSSLLTGASLNNFVFQYRHKDGTPKWGEGFGSLLKIRGRKRVMQLMLFDITERKHMEAALQESEEHYRLLFENAELPITVFDSQGRFQLINGTAAQNLRKRPEDLIGMSMKELFPDSADLYLKRNQQVFESGKGAYFEDFVDIPSGGKWFWSNLQPVKDSDGKIYAVQIVSYDTTARKLAEEALREKDYIIDSASSVIATTDLEGKMTYANPAFLKKWGFDRAEEFLGRPFVEFWMVEKRLDEVMEALQGEGVWSDEIKAKRKDGSLFDVQVSAAMVRDREGNPVALTSTSIDITKRKQAEAQREKLIIELKDALAKIKTLSGIIPICAKCKKIRDDEGYWNQVEVYVRDHTEAEFSHGLCPECVAEMEKKIDEME